MRRNVSIKVLDVRDEEEKSVMEIFDTLQKTIQNDGLYRTDLLYRGIDADSIPLLLRTGQDTNERYLQCSPEEYAGSEFPTRNVIFHAMKHDRSAVAVFDSCFLELGDSFAGYKFKNSLRKLDALVAIYELIWK